MKIAYTSNPWMLHYDVDNHSIFLISDTRREDVEGLEPIGQLKKFAVNKEYGETMVRAHSHTFTFKSTPSFHEGIEALDEEGLETVQSVFEHFRDEIANPVKKRIDIHWHEYHTNNFDIKTHKAILTILRDVFKGTDTLILIYDKSPEYFVGFEYDADDKYIRSVFEMTGGAMPVNIKRGDWSNK